MSINAICRDVSINNLGPDIPYQLPQNLQKLYDTIVVYSDKVIFPSQFIKLISFCRNLGCNNFSGSLPYSISQMSLLISLLVLSSLIYTFFPFMHSTCMLKLTLGLLLLPLRSLLGIIGTSATISFEIKSTICSGIFLPCPCCEFTFYPQLI